MQFLKIVDTFSKYFLRNDYVYICESTDVNLCADPFVRVVFLNHSQATESLRKTICPTWDQTLVFDTVDIHGDPQSVADNSPKIIVELFDYDSFVSCYAGAIIII